MDEYEDISRNGCRGSTVKSWVQDGSFRAVDDECFRPGQEGMMMNFEPVRSFQNYGGMVSRKVNSEMC